MYQSSQSGRRRSSCALDQRSRQLADLVLVAGRGDGDAAHVAADVEVRVVDPDRTVEPEAARA